MTAPAEPWQGHQRRSQYATARFVVGTVLGVLAVVGFIVAAASPWMEVPEPPGAAAARDIGELLFGEDAVSEILGSTSLGSARESTPEETRKLWLFPLAVLALGIIGLFLPGDRLRGSVLLGTAAAAGVVWFLVVAWIQDLLQMRTPLARFVSEPETWPVPAGPASLGVGVWVVLGATVLLLGAAAVNFCHRLKDGAIVFGSVAAVGLLGLAHLHDWFRSAEVDVQAKVHVGQPQVQKADFHAPSSEVEILIALTNHTRRPIVVVPAALPAQATIPALLKFAQEQLEAGLPPDVSFAGSAHGKWFEKYGRPDLVVGLEPRDGASKPGVGEPAGIPLAFGETGVVGSVVQPNEVVKISARFSPVWEQEHAAIDSMAGRWSACFRDADRQLAASTDFEVPGAVHPVVDKLLKAIQQAEEAIRPRPDASRLFQEPVQGFETIRESARACQSCMNELAGLKLEPAEDVKLRVERLTTEVMPTVELVLGFFAELDRGQASQAVGKLDQLREGATTEFGTKVAHALPRVLVEHARKRAQEDLHQDVLILLTAQPSLIEQAGLGPEAAALLEVAVLEMLKGGLGLVGPNGTLGRTESVQEAQGIFKRPAIPVARPGTAAILPDGLLESAVEQATVWDPALKERPEVQYARLVARQQSGSLATHEVDVFGTANPQFRADEVSCWLGIKALEAEQFAGAEERFTEAERASAEGPYAPLARLGLSVARVGTTEEDLLRRVVAERQLLILLEQPQGWAQDVRRMIPPMLCRNLSETNWIEDITVISTPDELAAWQKAAKETIPWVQSTDEPTVVPLASAVRNVALDGGVVFVNYPLFAELAHLQTRRPGDGLLQGDAAAAGSLAFVRGILRVPYDVTASQGLVSATEAKREKVEPLLAANEQWLASAFRSFGRGNVKGTVVFLPDRLGATQDACRFLRGLVVLSLDAVRKMKSQKLRNRLQD